MIGGDVAPADEHLCSAKGCRRTAGHAVIWRNPKLHTAGAAQGVAGL